MNGSEFVQRRLDAFGRGAVDELADDYTETSIIMSPMGNLVGREQARALLAGFITEFGMPGTTFEVLMTNSTDRVGHFSWKAETPKMSYRFGNETYVLDDHGKIAVHVFDGDMTPK